jgi:hypothetical protein
MYITGRDSCSFAASPLDVRKGFAFPTTSLIFFLKLIDSRLRLEPMSEAIKGYHFGKAEPYRTSGGKAAQSIN